MMPSDDGKKRLAMKEARLTGLGGALCTPLTSLPLVADFWWIRPQVSISESTSGKSHGWLLCHSVSPGNSDIHKFVNWVIDRVHRIYSCESRDIPKSLRLRAAYTMLVRILSSSG